MSVQVGHYSRPFTPCDYTMPFLTNHRERLVQFLPLFSAMPRTCRLCGGVYLGGSVCSVPTCPRTGLRQCDVAALQRLRQCDAAALQRVEDAEPPAPVSRSPRSGGAASSEMTAPPIESGGLTLDEEMAELRGLLHELMEASTRIMRRFGVRYLHREISLLERLARVWGARCIRWGWRVQ